MGDGHAFRRHGIEQNQRNFLSLRFFKRCAVARRVEQIERKTIRARRKCAVDDLVLLNNVCALWCGVDDFNVRAGLSLQCGSCLLGTVIHLVKPGMDDLWNDHEAIAVLLHRTWRILRHSGNRQRKGSKSRQRSKLFHKFLPWKSDETSSRLTA